MCSRRLLATLLAGVLFLAACTSTQPVVVPVQTTTTTTTTAAPLPPTIRIGIAVNEAAPTASFDSEIEAILKQAAAILELDSSLGVDFRTISVETPGQAEGGVLSLINDGVSIVVTGCDDATVPSVVEAATNNELLAVTGCVALPRPDIARAEGVDRELFLDLSSLADNARAIATHAQAQGYQSLGVIRSTLLPDVERTCADLQEEVLPETSEPDAESGATTITAETTFVELVDAPADVVANLGAALPPEGELDAIVVCALAPAVGDIVAALRAADLTQPVIVPWYGDGQVWPEDTNNVTIVTPASRYGDDPDLRTEELFDALSIAGGDPDAVDVVTADTLAILVDAANRAGSVGSLRVADAIRDGDSVGDGALGAVSGELNTGGDEEIPVRRIYRLITVTNGEPSFTATISALDARDPLDTTTTTTTTTTTPIPDEVSPDASAPATSALERTPPTTVADQPAEPPAG